MDTQIFTPSCDICMDVSFALDRYPSLCKTQSVIYYHLNVYQEYLLKYISSLGCKCRSCHHYEIQEKLERYRDNAAEVWEAAIPLEEMFCNLDDCLKKNLINYHLVKIRDVLIEDQPIGVLNFYYMMKVLDLDLPRCVDCGSCLDFMSNLSIVTRLISKKMTIKEAKAAIYYDKQAGISDQLISLANIMTEPEFHITGSYTPNGKKLIYLDSNIFMDIEKVPESSELWQAINRSKKYCDYYYSPSHLEDILKRELSNESVTPILSTIEQITNNLFIHRVDNTMRLDYESPSSSYKRTDNEISKRISGLIEEKQISRLKSGDLFFPQYHTEDHKREINNKDLFGRDCKLLEVALRQAGATFTLDSIKNLDIRNIKYETLNDIIYKLLRAMDILNYRHEPLKNDKKLRSSVHDVEHLIYATYSNIFVTNDRPLYHRSKAILTYITPNMRVMLPNEFQKIPWQE